MNDDQPPRFKAKLTYEQIGFCFAHMLRDQDTFEFARQNLEPSDFNPITEMQCTLLWTATLQAASRNGGTLPRPATITCINTELSSIISTDNEVLPEIGERARGLLAWTFEFKEDQLNPAYCRELIRNLIIERKVIGDLNKSVSEFYKVGRRLDLPETLERAAGRIRELDSGVAVVSGNLREEWGAFQTRLQTFRGREFLGLRTGLTQLDERTLGLRGLILLGAMPNVGKTALVLHAGLNVIRNNPDACFLFISLEMDRGSLFTRVYCNLAEMDWSTLVRGDKSLRGGDGTYFTGEQQVRLKAADDWIATYGHRIRIHDRKTLGDGVTAASILREMNALKAQSSATRALVVIDYLQVIPVPANIVRNGELEADKYRLRVTQDVLLGTQRGDSSLVGDAVIVISETRKPSAGRKHWGEDLADLMGSARLGYGADAVLLYRRVIDDEDIEEAYGANEGRTVPTTGQLENEGIAPIMLTLAKGRDGMRLGEWPLEYHFNRSIFREIERRRPPQLPAGRRPPSPRQAQPSADPPDPLGSLDRYD